MSAKEIVSAVGGYTVKEGAFSGTVAAVGTVVTAYLGGWDVALKVLVFCMVADYVTGLLGAIRTKKVNSEVMFWGGIRKGVVLVVIAMAVMLDQLVGNETPVFRTLALYFYIGREGLSIIENLDILGVPFPSWVKKVLEQMRERGDNADRERSGDV
ncbi:hypothetical protein BSNK01_11770 [Bacillaceae bacterium]